MITGRFIKRYWNVDVIHAQRRHQITLMRQRIVGIVHSKVNNNVISFAGDIMNLRLVRLT